MGNIWSANILLGIPIDEQIHAKRSKSAYIDQSIKLSKEIISEYPSCEMVANTFRFDKEENQILYYTSLYQGGQNFQTPDFNIGLINDRSGSGDCFMAGLIYGILQNDQPQNILNFATAAAVGKLKERGDGTRQDIEAVNRLLLHYL
jgi:2-dehydro-3-deoxygluconokinase